MEVTIGGNRVGSGKKMRTHINNYNRSTHNLSTTFATSMAPGVLIPCYKKICMRGDKFDIDLNADCRTIPTLGPLFGSFKMQIDFYECPIRLYQGILHNNPRAIGLNMKNVKFPIFSAHSIRKNEKDLNSGKFANNSLVKYMGLSGIGVPINNSGEYYREFNAIPILAYYDIYKNYYANKQEDIGYYIGEGKNVEYIYADIVNSTVTGTNGEVVIKFDNKYMLQTLTGIDLTYLPANKAKDYIQDIYIHLYDIRGIEISPIYYQGSTLVQDGWKGYTLKELLDKWNNNLNNIEFNQESVIIEAAHGSTLRFYNTINGRTIVPYTISFNKEQYFGDTNNITIHQLPLEYIDNMRYQILASNQIGETFNIDEGDEPYCAFCRNSYGGNTVNKFPMFGLCLKTYQNDIFNNWLNSEWIEGENSVNEMAKVATGADGSFTIDALNMAMKLYVMLNRIALSGNTYEDWQNVVYEDSYTYSRETPIWIGGMSKEVVFDEVVQTTPAEGEPLGALGGRGRATNEKNGGHITVKCSEACYIIGIVSLTPRIFYTQGNEFDMTDIFSMDDLHKPALDGIGFQNLLGERMLWSDATINGTQIIRTQIGKLPAWIEYMTDYDKAYGDFAETEGRGYMILNRNYESDIYGKILDPTTYIDPAKYNYAFANASLEAQNFWVEIKMNIKARRLMSARIIPNV